MRNVVLILVLLLPNLSLAEVQCESSPLNILLTNDDGVHSDGIKALHRALAGAGHRVKRVAPDRNYSGSAASISLDDRVAIKRPGKEFSEIYAVDGSPATAVVLGGTAIFGSNEPLNLVVSGINSGANVGPAAPLSGTVGAVVVALRHLDPSVPGIAISTARFDEDNFDSMQHYLQHLSDISGFVTRLINASQCSDRSFFTSGQSLNINYPPLNPSEIKGVQIARQGVEHWFQLKFVATGVDHYKIQFRGNTPSKEMDASDTILYDQSYITVVPIDGDYSATPIFDTERLLQLDP